MQRLGRWLLTAGVAYATLVVLVWALQGCMIHIPSRTLAASPAAIGLGYEDVRLETEDGERLHAWYLPAPSARGTLLFFHGNAGNISHRLDSLQIFHDLALNVLIVDYRGYGESSGRPSERGLYRDGQAAFDYLLSERDEAPERLIFFGRSLGAAVAAETARGQPIGGLILESGFTSVPDIGADLYPFLPVRWLTRYRYDARAALAEVEAPVLVVHSPDDEIIPERHGRALYDAASEPKRFLAIRGDHNHGFLRSRETYIPGLDAFLTEVLGR
ncbi:alpha/beta hydrolase [Marinimicrobium alkaliphilum]|uniref:alpha/beta hydrolase n=1 Tax=Marinimicrobium alkaliphilum TaxID=2202654 RepID=UPI000DBA52DE|nr:alpha/beta hydrolase [Marinimicrobium alkaliphilum]